MAKTIRTLCRVVIFVIVMLPFHAAADGDRHGSIAFSQEADGGYAWGITWSWDGRIDAIAAALAECREQGGSNCTEVGWFSNACGALAIGSGNGFGSGWGDSLETAKLDALSECEVLNEDCRIVEARCAQSEEDETAEMQAEAPMPQEAVVDGPLFLAFSTRGLDRRCDDWGLVLGSDLRAAKDEALAKCQGTTPRDEEGIGLSSNNCTVVGQRLPSSFSCFGVVKATYSHTDGRSGCKFVLGSGESAKEAERRAVSRCEVEFDDFEANCQQIVESQCGGSE